MSKTKTLQQIKDHVAQLNGYPNWESISLYEEIADFERASLIDDVAKHYASEEVKIAKEEIKEKCQIAFRNFMLRAALANVSGESLDFEKEFAEMMSKI